MIWKSRSARLMRAAIVAAGILAIQRADGGWSQTPDLKSDAYATGQTLFALAEAGTLTPSDPAYQKGVKFLLATRHADAVDIKFLVSGRPVWIAVPHPAWVEYNQRTGRVLTDPLAIQIAGHYLKYLIESGSYEHGREMYTLTVEETLEHLNAVLKEVGAPQDALVTTA